MENSIVSLPAIFLGRKNKPFGDFSVLECAVSENEEIPTGAETGKRKDGRKTIIVTGNSLPELKHTEVLFSGIWKDEKPYGFRFKAFTYEIKKPENEDGMAEFLAFSVKGVGKITAERIVGLLGLESGRVISEEPLRLCQIRGISRKKAYEIRSSYLSSGKLSEALAYFSKFGIGPEKVSVLFKKAGENVLEKVKKNPYFAVNMGLSFRDCDFISKTENRCLSSPERERGLLKYILSQNTSLTGDVCMEYEKAESVALSVLLPDISKEDFRQNIKKSFLNKDFVFRGKYIFDKFYDDIEKKITEKIKELLEIKPEEGERENIRCEMELYEKDSPFKLSESQRNAVFIALTERFSVITGGAGSGKTTIQKEIIEIYEKVFPGKKVTLLSPTGKAARRLTEKTGKTSETIHKALGIYGEGFEKKNLLEDGLIIVDEASMMGELLTEKLLSAVGKDSRVVLVGDSNQLPSVEAGNVLHDLIESDAVPFVRLTSVFRQGENSLIVRNAEKVILGDPTFSYDDSFLFLETNGEEETEETLKKIYLSEVKREGIGKVAVLCPMRNEKAKVSSSGLNPKLRELVSRENVFVRIGNETFSKGDRIIQMVNNLPVSANGDVGTIIEIAEEDGKEVFEILFDGEESPVKYTREDMKSVSLSYAITIHKSQGSEYETVIIPILKSQRNMLNKNLLYTGITRAKKKVILIGERSALTEAVKSENSNKRKTKLKERLYLSLKS